jgi:hypothetical protein
MDDLGRYISVETASLIERVFDNKGAGVLRIPFYTFHNLLRQVAQRCTEINDPRLNELMLRLNLYDVPKEERTKLITQMIAEQENGG